RRSDATLRAVLGQGVAGELVLDLRRDGPHALVGGTTGSGKSEFLQAWVLATATAHSPDRVTFLFVDYKGGAAFADCVELPHCVGLVTDLTPHLVRRPLTSLRAELRRREHLLQRKKAKDLLSLERTGDPETPPALVIVVDEFAALVSEVPEFVDGVVDVAQRGRSLGLHLVLATQRPAGVIKDNLRANTNLRIALRTADEQDSTDVLGSPVSAHFDPAVPGRGAVRTGPGRIALFQSA
ncbi:FtsK/SpoIIIE domain-containing protein, partial [Streptomyces sp. SID12501]